MQSPTRRRGLLSPSASTTNSKPAKLPQGHSMVLICQKCEARLQLDEAKTQSHPFTVRCPKCQTSDNVQAASAVTREPSGAYADALTEASPNRTFFERPA